MLAFRLSYTDTYIIYLGYVNQCHINSGLRLNGSFKPIRSQKRLPVSLNPALMKIEYIQFWIMKSFSS